MRTTIEGHPYTVGLRWQPVESAEDIADRRDETGLDWGVILKRENRIVGVGLRAERDDDRDPAPSAAALLALAYPEAVIAVEWADTGVGPPRYWFAAVLHGAVVAGTDVLLDDAATVAREIADLAADYDYRLAGTASAEFCGDGAPALTPARTKARLAAATIRHLGRGARAGQLARLGALAAAVLAVGWWILQPGTPEAVAPATLDHQAAEQRAAAIAARNQQLSDDLSGFDALALARWGARAGKTAGRSAALWRFARKGCTGTACTLTWQALDKGATPAGLAAALGLARDRIDHDLQAEAVTVSWSLGAAPARIEATDATVLAGRLPPLVDRCRKFQGLGGTCTLEPPQPPPIPNAERLPPELNYRTGRLVLAGPLGRAEVLLPLFSGEVLTPWVRAENLDFDYETLEFHLEGHYVIP
jgi:hypothetical protein